MRWPASPRQGEATTGRAADVFYNAEAIGAVLKQHTVARITLKDSPGDVTIEAVVSFIWKQLAHLVA